MNSSVKSLLGPFFSRQSWRAVRDYVGLGKNRKAQPIHDTESLSDFIATRSSHVAQSSLYGYLRTRAGTRFPELFERPDMVESINISKWHIWLACLSDLCVFFGQLLHDAGYSQDAIHNQINAALNQVLEKTGTPEEAGEDYTYATEKVLQRINTCDWSVKRDDDMIFSESPDALVYWAPIAHELKQRDEEIVLNSIRFRWIEIRRSARKLLDTDALMRSPEPNTDND